LIVIAQSLSFEVIPGIIPELVSGVELRTGPLLVVRQTGVNIEQGTFKIRLS